MHNVRIYILLFTVFFAFNSCSKNELEAEIPSYIQINPFTLTTIPLQGSNSQNITDGWVYIDNDLVGAFELPARIPILKEGLHKIDVYPGIKENGIAQRRAKYLFYNAHSENLTLEKSKTTIINPKTTYTSTTTFYWMEDFESASLPFTYSSFSDTVVYKSTDAFEGNYSGKVSLIPGMTLFECYTPEFSDIPTYKPIFLELDFKTNQPVLVGLYADNDQIGIFYLNTTDKWKKIYLDFSEPLRSRPNAAKYKIFFGFQPKLDYPEFMFDNLKIVHL